MKFRYLLRWLGILLPVLVLFGLACWGLAALNARLEHIFDNVQECWPPYSISQKTDSVSCPPAEMALGGSSELRVVVSNPSGKTAYYMVEYFEPVDSCGTPPLLGLKNLTLEVPAGQSKEIAFPFVASEQRYYHMMIEFITLEDKALINGNPHTELPNSFGVSCYISVSPPGWVMAEWVRDVLVLSGVGLACWALSVGVKKYVRWLWRL